MGAEKSHWPAFVLRVISSGDDSEVVAAIFREAKEAASWSEDAVREMIAMPGVSAYVSERDGTASGIVIGRQVLDEAEVLNLAVRQEVRRQGEGGALVRKLLERFTDQHVSRVFLEVRESNAGAIAFYQGLGFQSAGTRKGYYQSPSEDATVMEFWIRKSTD